MELTIYNDGKGKSQSIEAEILDLGIIEYGADEEEAKNNLKNKIEMKINLLKSALELFKPKKQNFECYEIHRANMPQYGCNEQCKECLEKQSGKFINGEYPTNVLLTPQLIGKIMFQFDEDEPQLLTTLLKEAEFTIRITQSESSSIQFESKNGKKFKIFYEKI